MKKYLLMMLSALLICSACSDENEGGYTTYQFMVQVVYPSSVDWNTEGLLVKLTDANGSVYEANADDQGRAGFTVPLGIYEVSVSDKRAADGIAYVYNGIKSGITITNQWENGTTVEVSLVESKAGQVLLKEIYVGGCQKNDGSGTFQYDRYAILYNNSDQVASLQNLCFGLAAPTLAHSPKNDYDTNGNLVYATENYIPAGAAGIWYLPRMLTIEPYSQVVVAFNSALDNTATYHNSVDLSKAEYYVCYDIDDFNHKLSHPAPSENIPTTNYFQAAKFGQGSSWVLSYAPAMFIFTTQGVSPEDFAADVNNYHYYAGAEGDVVYRTVKVPTDWILDGVEIFSTSYLEKSKKRLTPAVDGGYVLFSHANGYSCYRNVDKEATEAIEENRGKLVYNYAYGTLNLSTVENGSTDLSGIDAEASIRNGAKIVYQDTNNSTNDFHQRKEVSLKF